MNGIIQFQSAMELLVFWIFFLLEFGVKQIISKISEKKSGGKIQMILSRVALIQDFVFLFYLSANENICIYKCTSALMHHVIHSN